MARQQGDLKLLENEVAKRLLKSTVPARFAYVSMDGTPRVVPTWFHWTGDELVMPTFLSAPTCGMLLPGCVLYVRIRMSP